MFKISLMDHSDLEESYKIEMQINPSPWSRSNYYSSFEVGHKSLVCRFDQKIIGFIIFSVNNPESHILNIGVQEEWQNKGAGGLLLKYMINQCKVMGVRKVFLEVRSKNKKAICFYQKFKFKKDAMRANYYTGDNPDDAILMSLDI